MHNSPSRIRVKGQNARFMAIRFILLGFSLVLGTCAKAQPLSTWRSLLPSTAGVSVTQSQDEVYFTTGQGLVVIGKEDFSVDFLSKVDGFSESTPRLCFFHQPTGVLVVAYDNSVLDLVLGEQIVTNNQIPNFDGISTDKGINRIRSFNDSTLLLATNYGLSEFNLKRLEFGSSAFPGFPIFDLAVYRDTLYAAAEDGIYRVALASENLADFGNWELLGEEEGFPPFVGSRSLAVFQDFLYFNLGQEVFRYRSGAEPEFVTSSETRPVEYLSASPNNLVIGFGRCPSDCSPRTEIITAQGILQPLAANCSSFIPRNAIEDEQGRIWLADEGRGFRWVENLDPENCNIIPSQGPPSIENRAMAVWENQLWLASGGLNQNLGNRFVRDGFSSLIDGDWTTYNVENTPEFENDPNDFNDNLLDFVTVAVEPSSGVVYAGSFMRGLARWDGEEMQVFDESNSPLGRSVVLNIRNRVAGLAFDEENTLWMTNTESTNALVSRNTEGEWASYRLCGDPTIRIYEIDVDQNGFKWVTAWNAGVYVYDEGQIEDPADDRCRLFTPQNSNLPSNRVRCVAVDLNGDVWVGTEKGVVIFECGSSAFEDICLGTLRIVEQDGFNAFLLETENVTTIAVDGANRKWIGTNNGIFVLSPSGEEEVMRFTESNSPLFSNTIIDITINPENGEVFIGTLRGIQSYLSDAIEGGAVHRAKIEVYPNPVRPEYDGSITLRGLARDAIVKITDLSGRLVFETEALGGQAVWDGRDYNGRRVATGVYLIFSTSNPDFAGFDGKADAEVGKIVFIN